MTHGDRLHAKRSQLDGVADPHLAEVRLAQEPVLLELRLHQAQRQPGAVNGDVDLLERIRQAADVVFVAVRKEDAEYLFFRLHQVGDVRQDEVDAGHVLLRKHQAGIDDQDLVVPLEGPHVDADLPETAEREVTKSPALTTGAAVPLPV